MNRKTRFLTGWLLIILALVSFAIVPAASAYDGRSGDSVAVGRDEVVDDDLFVSAGSVVVDGVINGDLFAVGQTVVVNGRVTGNLLVAGSSVTVNGEVGHAVFAAAAAVTIGPNARIAHNVYTGGGGVESQAGGQIDGSLFIGAGQALLSGQVGNDLLAGVGRLRLEGAVGRNARIAVDAANNSPSSRFMFDPNMPSLPNVPPGLTFGDQARVAGSLAYTSAAAVPAANRVATQVTHSLPPQDQQLAEELSQRESASSYLFDALRRLIALLLIGLLIAWSAPRWITAPAEQLAARPLPSLGIGLVGLIAAPIGWLTALGVVIAVAVVFGLLSLGALTGLTLLAGLPTLGLAIVAGLFVVTYLCQAIVAYLLGRWIVGRFQPKWGNRLYAPLLIGLPILGLLIAAPFVGGLIQFLVVLAGLGAIALEIFRRRPLQTADETPAIAQA